MVAVSAGDSLETVMAAYGSGAVARSIRDSATVMNVDIGGGTSKIAVCADGKVIDLTAIDVGARLVCLDDDGTHRAHRGSRPPLRRRARHRARARRARLRRSTRARLPPAWRIGCSRRCAAALAVEPAAPALLRLDRLSPARHDRPGHLLRRRVGIHLRPRSAEPSAISARCSRRKSARASRAGDRGSNAANEGIRATVIGASQYTTQVSGSTIFVSPLEPLPLRNVPVIAPALALDADVDRCRSGRRRDQGVLRQLDLAEAATPGRGLRAVARVGHVPAARRFCQRRGRGARAGARARPSAGAGRRRRRRRPARHSPARGDAARQTRSSRSTGSSSRNSTTSTSAPCCRHSGAVPVVIKSLIFPSSATPGKEWLAAEHVVTAET